MLRHTTLILAVFLLNQATYAATTLDTKAFIDSIQGTYLIEEVGGHPPKPDNSLADVYADTDEGVLTLPYCPSGGFCDPGYIFLSYANTTTTEATLSDGSVQVTFEVNDGSGKKYSWTSANGKVSFFNPNYKVNGAATPLTHQLTKQIAEP